MAGLEPIVGLTVKGGGKAGHFAGGDLSVLK